MILLDSHVFLWLLYEPKRIGSNAKNLITAGNPVYVSIVSLWELALKHAAGKLPYSPKELSDGLSAAGVSLLPLKPAHLLDLAAIKLPHKDPFDQLLAAQSTSEGSILVTADRHILESEYNTIDVTQ